MTSLLFLVIPVISELSMRQVAQLSITLSLSLLSVIMLLLSVFLGGTSVWKDTERRYTYSVLGLPMTRTSYLLGKFFGIAACLLLTALALGSLGFFAILYMAKLYPPSPGIIWSNIFFSILFIAFKFILLVSCAFLLSTVSTSFFLPIFGSLAVFFAGTASQQVFDYMRTPAARSLSPVIKFAATALYYVLPNFTAFDLSVHAIYSLKIAPAALMLTMAYFIVYTAIMLWLAAAIFSRREFL